MDAFYHTEYFIPKVPKISAIKWLKVYSSRGQLLNNIDEVKEFLGEDFTEMVSEDEILANGLSIKEGNIIMRDTNGALFLTSEENLNKNYDKLSGKDGYTEEEYYKVESIIDEIDAYNRRSEAEAWT